MQVDLLGGFDEKGRTCIGVRRPSGRVLFDLGIKVGAAGAEYYPALDGPADGIEAVLVSHAHEDHGHGHSRAHPHSHGHEDAA